MQHHMSGYYKAPEKAAMGLATLVVLGAIAYYFYKSK